MTVLFYSPSQCDPEKLFALDVGESRARVRETLLQAVVDDLGEVSHQHHLIIGPRGFGKTHLLTLLAETLRTDRRTRNKVLPIQLAEEEVAAHPADLLIRIVERFISQLEGDRGDLGKRASRALSQARDRLERLMGKGDDAEALTLAHEVLEEISRTTRRLLVPIVENLDAILFTGAGGSKKALEPQWALRDLLQTSKGILLIAAAPAEFGEATEAAAPFYGFFRRHNLDELSPDEMIELFRKRLEVELAADCADSERRRRLLALRADFDARIPQLRGLLTLTGGLPRFGHLIFDILAETDVRSSFEMLRGFLDKQTPYFQTRLDPRLTPRGEAEVLDTIAMSPGPMRTGEIAAALRGVPPNQVASLLKRLMERGLVRKKRGRKRTDVRYDVSEPLFRVWRRFRTGRSEQRSIMLLAEIVAAMFSPDDLLDERKVLAERDPGCSRLVLLDAAIQLQRRGTATGEEPSVPPQFADAEAEFAAGSFQNARRLSQVGIAALRAEGREEEAARRLPGLCFSTLLVGKKDEAMKLASDAYLLASETDDDWLRAGSLLTLATVLSVLDRNDQALKACEKAEALFGKVADDLGRGNGILFRGSILFNQGQTDEALKANEEAEIIFGKVGNDLGLAGVQSQKGQFFCRSGDLEAGLELLLSACSIQSEMGVVVMARNTAVMAILAVSLGFGVAPFATVKEGLRRVAPLIEEYWDERTMRSLVSMLKAGLGRLSLDEYLELLPVVEARLPEGSENLTMPFRLAAEVRAGKQPEELPDQPEEMRRVVLQLLERTAKDETT